MPKLFLKEDRLNEILELSRVNTRDHAIFEVAISTGLRVSDLVALNLDDVSEGGEVMTSLKIRMQKTGKVIERRLRESCIVALRDYIRVRKPGPGALFLSDWYNSRGTRLTRSAFHLIFKKYLAKVCKPAELKGNSCHVTRRSVAQLIVEKTGKIQPASRFLGHSSIGVTTAYLDMDEAGREAELVVCGLFCK